MALTLKSNITSNYKSLSKRPRVFVRIPSAGLFLGTKNATLSGVEYEDSITSFDNIVQSIATFGGMSEVSSFGIKNLELGQRFTLCTEANLTPKFESYMGAGRLYRNGFGSYSDARNNVSAHDFGSPAVVVGRRFMPGANQYQVIRGYMQFSIPAGITSCEEAVIELTGTLKQSNQGFYVQAVLGTWSALSDTLGLYNDFSGWEMSGAYGVTNLAESWSTADFIQGTNKIRLNVTGRNQVIAKTGSTLKLMLLSSLDSSNASAPTADEYMQFDIANVALKLRYNTITLDNQDAEIYLAYEPIPTTYTDMQMIWKGVIDDYSLDKSSLNLQLKQNDHKKNAKLPKSIITIDNHPYCPESNIGKAKPILYGNFPVTGYHKDGVGAFSANDIYNSVHSVSTPNCFKLIVTENIDNDRGLMACGHNKVVALPAFGGNFIYAYNSSINAFDILPVSGVSAYVADKGFMYDIEPYPISSDFPQNLAQGKIKAVTSILPDGNYISNATNPEYSYDDDPDNYTTLAALNSYIEYTFSNLQGTSTSNGNAFVVNAKFTGGADATKLWAKLYKNDRDNIDDPDNWVATGSDASIFTADGQAVITYIDNTTASNTPIEIENYKIRLYKKDATGEAHIYNVCVLIARDCSSDVEFYTGGMGKFDDASGTVTGTGSSLIENPAHIIESFARDEMGLTTDEINTTRFDTSATALSAWKYAFQINERDGARNYLNNFYRQCRSKGLWDEQDRLSIRTFSSSNKFPYSLSDVPYGLDIFDTTGTPSGEYLTTNPIFDFSIERMDLDDTYNDFVLKYRKNYATNDYLESLYITNGLGVVANIETNINDSYLENSQTLTALKALLALSYNNYQTTNTLEFEADCIRDEKTATMLLQYLIERLYKRRYIITVKTAMNAIGIDLGDFINIRQKRLYDLFGETTACIKKWEVIRKEINLNDMTITFKTIEVD